MATDKRKIVESIVEGGATSTANHVRRALATPGPVTVELNDWFIEIDDSHTTVKVELDSVPDLSAEMSLDEFLAYADEFAAR